MCSTGGIGDVDPVDTGYLVYCCKYTLGNILGWADVEEGCILMLMYT